MTEVATERAPSRSRTHGFIAASVSFVAVFAAGATPIPLYDTYRRFDGLTNDEFSLVAVAYFACAVLALLVLGRLSDFFGRRPVAIAALLIAAAGSVVLMFVDGFPVLLVGRALQGLAAGLASSAIGAYAVDTAHGRPSWVVATVTTAAATVGLAIGVFTSGALVQFAPAARILTYIVFAVILLGCAVAIATGPETVKRAAGAGASLIPRLEVPKAVRPFLPTAIAVFVATWALGGYFNSFSPSITSQYLHSDSPLVAATVFASYMAPSVIGGFGAARLRSATAQRLGMTLVAIAGAGLTVASVEGLLALFIASGVAGGVGMGFAMAGSMNTLLPRARPAERAGLLAVVYAISYTGSALPSLIAGQLSRVVDLPMITLGYAVLAGSAWLVTLLTARNPHER